jgi:hypothetical protein
MTAEARLRVLDVTKTAAIVVLLGDIITYGEAKHEVPDQESFYVKHRGKAKWSVVRKSDDTVVSQGHNTRDSAERELFNQLKAVGT